MTSIAKSLRSCCVLYRAFGWWQHIRCGDLNARRCLVLPITSISASLAIVPNVITISGCCSLRTLMMWSESALVFPSGASAASGDALSHQMVSNNDPKAC